MRILQYFYFYDSLLHCYKRGLLSPCSDASSSYQGYLGRVSPGLHEPAASVVLQPGSVLWVRRLQDNQQHHRYHTAALWLPALPQACVGRFPLIIFYNRLFVNSPNTAHSYSSSVKGFSFTAWCSPLTTLRFIGYITYFKSRHFNTEHFIHICRCKSKINGLMCRSSKRPSDEAPRATSGSVCGSESHPGFHQQPRVQQAPDALLPRLVRHRQELRGPDHCW